MSPLPGGMQVTLCDPIWHVSSSSGVATSVSELLYPCYFTLLYLLGPVCDQDSGMEFGSNSTAKLVYYVQRRGGGGIHDDDRECCEDDEQRELETTRDGSRRRRRHGFDFRLRYDDRAISTAVQQRPTGNTLVHLGFISERELAFTFAICYRPSVFLLSVCRL